MTVTLLLTDGIMGLACKACAHSNTHADVLRETHAQTRAHKISAHKQMHAHGHTQPHKPTDVVMHLQTDADTRMH